MLMPSIFGENLFDDDWMDFPFERFDRDFWGKKNPLYGKNAKNMMKTDIREHEAGYELDIDLPGFKKDEITVDLENGYLTISAAKGLDKDEEDKKGKYIRKERYAGTMQRSFYVGDARLRNPLRLKDKFISFDKFLTVVNGNGECAVPVHCRFYMQERM